ncbi:hypothetical protein V8B97DRAFT_1515270 [Scleroderma yunnanense]
MTSVRPLFVVAGVGLIGTGASTARLFAQKGYNVALISRGHEALEKLVQDINQDGGVAASIPVADYSANSICAAFKAIRFIFPSDTSHLRVALFNAGYGVWKPFLNITDDDLSTSLEVNVTAAFAFSREVITEFLKLGFEEPSEHGQGGSRKRGTLLFTGATASIRGSATTSAFSAGKQGLRALSQSLAKEFGKQNIHVRLFTLVDYSFTYWHTIIDGVISKEPKFDDVDNVANTHLDTFSIAKCYLGLVQQDSSAWSWEIDLRPAHEKW